MRHELIVLPKSAHARIAEAIRSGGVEVELCEDTSIKRHRHPGDSLYLCRHGEAAVELLVPGKDELPEKFGDYTCVVFFPYGGFMRQFRHRSIDAKLQQLIGGILHQLKLEFSHDDA
jgi:hypothetical protein